MDDSTGVFVDVDRKLCQEAADTIVALRQKVADHEFSLANLGRTLDTDAEAKLKECERKRMAADQEHAETAEKRRQAEAKMNRRALEKSRKSR